MADQKGAFNPSRCEITSAEIVPFGKKVGDKSNIDIADMIASFSMHSAVNKSALHGKCDVYDAIGILENLPLRGEEEIHLTIKAFDLQTELELACFIYKIDDLDIRKDQTGLSYTLHWVSKISYEASRRNFITSFNGKTSSTIVKELFKKYYHGNIDMGNYTGANNKEELPPGTMAFKLRNDIGRYLYIEKTEHPMQLTIPDLSPAQAIQFVGRRTWGMEPNAGSSFRWFENTRGFYFVSDEWLYEYGKLNGGLQFQYGAFISLDAEDAIEQMTSLSQFGNPLRVDTGSQIQGGAYKVKIIEVDILKQNITDYSHSFDYQKDFLTKFRDSTGNSATIKNDIHTEDFINKTFTDENAKQFMIIRDYKDDTSSKAFKSETNFRNLVAQRTFYRMHALATSTVGITDGRLDVKVGDIIRINTLSKNISSDKEDNPQISGRFLVTSIDNDIENGELKTIMSMFKYDWSDAGEDDGKRTKVVKPEDLKPGSKAHKDYYNQFPVDF